MEDAEKTILDHSLEINADVILVGYVDQANKKNIKLPITIFVGGVMFSGTIISQEEYIKMIFKQFNWTDPTELLEKINSDTNLPHYIHLKDWRPLAPGINAINTNNAPLRFKLSAIDGFVVGSTSMS